MELQASTRALYVISVAAELAGVHPQTLRIYERKGLIEPARTRGGNRRYSDRDIQLLRRVQELTQAGVSLAGVQRVLEVEEELAEARVRIEQLERALEESERARADVLAAALRRRALVAHRGPGPARPGRPGRLREQS